jgi:hypothetical protein
MSRWLAVLVWAAGFIVHAQEFSQRGFVDIAGNFYPQTVPTDGAHATGRSLVRYEPKWQPKPWFTLNASFEALADSHREVARTLHVDWQDRSLARPGLSVRQLSAVFTRDSLAITAGKQFLRWGEADFLNPTDRFAPKDLLDIVDQDVLAVTAARLTYSLGENTFDFVWQPWLTPGRIPLINQRWTFLPAASDHFDVVDLGSVFPGRSAFGARWSHAAAGYEYSLSYYDGFNYLPAFIERLDFTTSRVTFSRMYPALRLYGGDFAMPVTSFTLKGEAAYYTSPTKQQDEYVLYVTQLERQIHELRVVAGYAGELVTAHGGLPQFPAERGLARAVFANVHYTLDSNRTLTLDAFVRQNGRSNLIRPGYSQSFGDHWRATVGFAWLRGEKNDFLGQDHRNSFATVELRYSF